MRLKLWAMWTLLNGIELALIVTGGLLIDFSVSPLLGWIMTGVILSYLQQWATGDLLSGSWGWYSSMGWVMGVILGRWLNGWTGIGWDLDWMLLGLSVGVAQWLNFQDRPLHTWGWLLVSTVGFVVGATLGGATLLLESWFMFKGIINIPRSLTEQISYVIGGLVGGAVYGAISGGWLIAFYKDRKGR